MTVTDLRLAEALAHDRIDKRLDILRRIDEAGSISEAARGAGVSYKAAWQALETLGNLAGTELVEKVVGGTGGGGARLTAAGRRVLRVAGRLDHARAAVLADLAREESADPASTRRTATTTRGPGLASASAAAAAALGLRPRLRHQLPCQVSDVRPTGALVRVSLALADGMPLAARITQESAELLGIESGVPVLALCKATAVTVTASGSARAGRNRLKGRVIRTGATATGDAEVTLALPGGLRLVGFATAGHGLAVDRTAVAEVDETGVVIALIG